MINTISGRIGGSISRWRQARDGRRRLEHLNDRLLADIGISRSQIYSAAMRGRERS